MKRRSVGLGLAMMVLGVLPTAVGCGAFFQCEGKTDCSNSTAGNTGNVVYVSNNASTSLYAYYISSTGTLGAVSGSPYSLSYAPYSLTLTPDNSVLYVSDGDGIVLYDVTTATGVLSNATRQSVATVAESSMAVSPDGKWLLALDYNNGSTAPYCRIYAIGTGGTLNQPTTTAGFPLSSSETITSRQISFSPDGEYVALSLGSAGTFLYNFATATGVLSGLNMLGGTSAVEGNNAAVFDSSDYLYISETGTNSGIAVINAKTGAAVGTSGTLTSPYATGTGPLGLTFANSYGYLYTANYGDATISADTASAGSLSTLASAVAAPSQVQAITRDTTSKYILAAGISATSGLQIFTIGTSGALTAGTTAATGTTNGVPVLVATH